LGDAEGWHVQFGRELNASDDRHHLHEGGDGLPIIEGKHLRPFGVDVRDARFKIRESLATTLVDPSRTFHRRRLAYREVAASTNRLTLIAVILPAGTLTTHTVFCLKDALEDECQDYLCAIFNSFVANYFVRMRVTTHVTSRIIDRLPVPVLQRDTAQFREIADLSRVVSLATAAGTARAGVNAVSSSIDYSRARLQALVAKTYRLEAAHFAHILATFPLVTCDERDAAMNAFYGIVP
jgi:hypothetical protein